MFITITTSEPRITRPKIILYYKSVDLVIRKVFYAITSTEVRTIVPLWLSRSFRWLRSVYFGRATCGLEFTVFFLLPAWVPPQGKRVRSTILINLAMWVGRLCDNFRKFICSWVYLKNLTRIWSRLAVFLLSFPGGHHNNHLHILKII